MMDVRFATEPADPSRANEDYFGFTEDVFVLLDGAGTPAGSDSGCIHGVAWYARTLGKNIVDLAQPTRELTLKAALAEAISATAQAHKCSCDLSHPETPSATVLIVRLSEQDLEYLVLADSTLVIDTSSDLLVLTDRREADVGQTLRQAMDEVPTGSPAHDDAHRQYVEAMRQHRNTPDGFWVAGADPGAADEALTGTIPRHTIQAFALMSDGATRLVDRFGLDTWDGLMSALSTTEPDLCSHRFGKRRNPICMDGVGHVARHAMMPQWRSSPSNPVR